MTAEPAFDPTAPLAGPPDPWEGAPTPSMRARSAVSHDRHDRGRTGARRRGSSSGSARRVGLRPSWPTRSARRSRRVSRSSSPAAGPPSMRALAAAEILREAAHAAGLPDASGHRRAGLRAVARPADPRPRHRDHPRRRHDRDERGPPRGARRGPVDGGGDGQPPLPGRHAGRDRRRDRGARPRLVPHGRLPEPGRRGGVRRRAISRDGRSTPTTIRDLARRGQRATNPARNGSPRPSPTRRTCS